MEFVDNTGHIFSLPSFTEKPIGYEYDEYSYIFWIDSTNTSRLSVNNHYVKPIYALYELQSLSNEGFDHLQIDIYCEKSNVFSLISSKEISDYIMSDNYNDLNDYIDLNDISTNNSFIKSHLTQDDLCVYKTTETIHKENRQSELDYLLIPIYPIAMSSEEGTWITNVMIHIHDTNKDMHEWCYISVGAEFIDEYEELTINGKNMGVSLPKDILKAVYSESLYNDAFNESLYNEKLKEYLLNYMSIKGECGNFNSAINSLKWFGYGDKLSIFKLLKTDNNFIGQYIEDYFDISNDVIYAFKNFISDALISIRIMINAETDELYPFVKASRQFYGENKPKTISLLDTYDKIKIGNHDMPIENDDEKYWYVKPYFDFSFTELGIKLMCLKTFYKKYFLPLHLNIHSATLGYRVFMNDIKLTTSVGCCMTEPLVMVNGRENEVKFLGNGLHNFTKQTHYVDDFFNEFSMPFSKIENGTKEWFFINDTCVNIPIQFKNPGYYNCVLLLHKKNSDEVLYESHFSFAQTADYKYANFIIYPKKLNRRINKEEQNGHTVIKDIISNYYEYWINSDFKIRLLVNNKWYEYDFRLYIHNPTIDFGTLRYRYWLNEHNYLTKRMAENYKSGIHSLVFADSTDITGIMNGVSIQNAPYYNSMTQALKDKDINYVNNALYEIFELDDSKSFIKTLDLDTKHLYQYLESNYNVLSPFTQINGIFNGKVSFNAYMHNTQLVDVNNIDFDIDFYKILKYHLDRNLLYIDGTLVNNQFYKYIIYNHNGIDYEIVIHKDLIGYDIEVPEEYLYEYSKVLVCAYQSNLYILVESGQHDDSYLIIDVFSRDNSLLKLENPESIDGDDVLFVLDSFGLTWDMSRKEYYHTENDGSITYYPLYDRLYNNVDEIYGRYLANVNLPNIPRYKNNIHIFNLYTKELSCENVLVFHNDIDVYVNGLRFIHGKHSYNDDESLRFDVTGNIKYNREPNSPEANTKYLDVYGLHWVSNPQITYNSDTGIVESIENVPVEFVDRLSQYGIYVKRDYSLYNFEQTPNANKIDNVYDLPDINEYDTEEFSYYVDPKETRIGYAIFKTLDDFYNNVQYSNEFIEGYEDTELFIDDNGTYCFYDPIIRDLDDLTKQHKNRCSYIIEFHQENGEIIDGVSLNDLANLRYGYIQVYFFFSKLQIVRNRFYLLSEFVSNNNDKTIHIDFERLKINIDGTEYDIIKVSNKHMYVDNEFEHIISNQNPSMYWYSLDTNMITSLPSYINELERNAFDASKQSLESIIEQLDMYVAKYANRDPDDSKEAGYRYVNYLSKNLSGYEGSYMLRLDHNFREKDTSIRLCVDVVKDKDVKSYSTDDINKFELDGTEDSVMLYVQFKENTDTYIHGWFIPKLIRINSIDTQLKYDKDISGNELVVSILNKEYRYGDNNSSYVSDLYSSFFKLKFNIYDTYIKDDTIHSTLLNSVWDAREEICLQNERLDYDFYLMHDDQYWYCAYISKQTIDRINKDSDLKLDASNKTMEFDHNDITYVLKHYRTSQEYLINRMEFVSSYGKNQFNNDDIICAYIHNNDRLPFSPYISGKWSIKHMSIGSTNTAEFDSNAEMTILSIPERSGKHEPGYYKVHVKYSLDRDVQHQFKNTSTIFIK